MTGKLPSEQQKVARQEQSKADRKLANKQSASERQSEADQAAVTKHGL